MAVQALNTDDHVYTCMEMLVAEFWQQPIVSYSYKLDLKKNSSIEFLRLSKKPWNPQNLSKFSGYTVTMYKSNACWTAHIDKQLVYVSNVSLPG